MEELRGHRGQRMGRMKFAESGDVPDHPGPWTLAFTMGVMRNLQWAVNRKSIVLVVF